MNKQPTTSKSGVLSRFFKATFPTGLLAVFALLSSGHTSFAGSATWQTNPASGNWNSATNWMPNTVPDGPGDTATFQSSDVTDVTLSAPIFELDGIVFDAGASAYKFTATLERSLSMGGVGVTNYSGILQNFVAARSVDGSFFQAITFTNSATAGSLTTFTNEGATSAGPNGGSTKFFATSTAGNGIFTTNGGTVRGAYGGAVVFFNSSTAGNGTFTTNGGTVNGAFGGFLTFENSSTAANATLVAKGGLGGGAGGSIRFFQNSTGGTARVKVFGDGNLEIEVDTIALTVGSIEGDGNVFLRGNKLAVGSNNLSTNFSGMIEDGGSGGSLTKVGTGKLVLKHRNSYVGGTTINAGRLVINNIGGSGTGSGPVQVKGGKLAGKGEIAGAVTVGTGSGGGAVLAPGYLHGVGSPGALTIHSPLTFNSDATYEVGMNSSSVMADEVVALGVTINGAAQFAFVDIGSGSLPAGTTFTVINNTAATPIAGTFRNLPDGATFTSNGNKYKANYEGGDGNDLTLTVVP